MLKYEINHVNYKFKLLNDYLGLCDVGGFSRLRPHMLHKFHASYLSQGSIEINLTELEFEDGSYFRVVLRGPNGKLILPQNPTAEDFEKYGLNDRQIDALLKMKNEDAQFTYNSYADLHNISKSTAKRDLNMLFDMNLIRKITIKQTYYFFV